MKWKTIFHVFHTILDKTFVLQKKKNSNFLENTEKQYFSKIEIRFAVSFWWSKIVKKLFLFGLKLQFDMAYDERKNILTKKCLDINLVIFVKNHDFWSKSFCPPPLFWPDTYKLKKTFCRTSKIFKISTKNIFEFLLGIRHANIFLPKKMREILIYVLFSLCKNAVGYHVIRYYRTCRSSGRYMGRVYSPWTCSRLVARAGGRYFIYSRCNVVKNYILIRYRFYQSCTDCIIAEPKMQTFQNHKTIQIVFSILIFFAANTTWVFFIFFLLRIEIFTATIVAADHQTEEGR